MSKDSFKVKKGLTVIPVDPADITSPEAGDLIIDSTDSNKLKVYDPNASDFTTPSSTVAVGDLIYNEGNGVQPAVAGSVLVPVGSFDLLASYAGLESSVDVTAASQPLFGFGFNMGEFTLTATTVGTAGDNIALYGDDISDIQTLVSDWNMFNPTETVTLNVTQDGFGEVFDSSAIFQLANGLDPIYPTNSNSFTLTADNTGVAGNVTLTADGVKTVNVIVSDHNTANPANTVSIDIPSIEVPKNGVSFTLVGGAAASDGMGDTNLTIGTESQLLTVESGLPVWKDAPVSINAAITLQDIDWSTADVFYKDVSTNETFTFSNITDGNTIIVVINNTAVGTVTITFPTALKDASFSGDLAAATEGVYTVLSSNGKQYLTEIKDMS